MLSTANSEYPIGTLVFTVHNNEFRTSKIKRVVIDNEGVHYVLTIDNINVERGSKEIAKSKELLFNKMVDRYTARQNK